MTAPSETKQDISGKIVKHLLTVAGHRSYSYKPETNRSL